MEPEDEVSLLRKALDVSELPEDFDPNKIPQTGEEYLHYVMYEKMQCEEYVRKDVSKKKIKQKTWLVEVPQGCETAPKDILPSIEWQNKQVADFSSFRMHIARIRDNLELKVFFRKSEDYCLKKSSEEPKFSEAIAYNQNQIMVFLEHHVNWLDDIEFGQNITRETGIWLYTLLARLEVPLTPTMCSLIRELARKCSKIRSNLADFSEKEDYVPLNLIICLVARYFNQGDLADN